MDQQAPQGLLPIEAERGNNQMQLAPEKLEEIESIARHFRLRGKGKALFTGAAGTGKTFAAGVLADALGYELFRVDLAAITSKFIGETEKNLSRILEAAADRQVVLLFDEADGLFGKRSEIQDANDRYTNLEVNYLLQRVESYDGIAVLTANLRSDVDAAFVRRCDYVLELARTKPRRRLWWQRLLERMGILKT